MAGRSLEKYADALSIILFSFVFPGETQPSFNWSLEGHFHWKGCLQTWMANGWQGRRDVYSFR